MKITVVAALALLVLASNPAYAGSEDFPTPITRPIMTSMPVGRDTGPNGVAFDTTHRFAINNAGMPMSNSSEAEADSPASFPRHIDRQPVYAATAPVHHHG